MGARSKRLLERLSSGLWLVPVGCGLAGVAAGVLLPRIELGSEKAAEATRLPVLDALVSSTPDGAQILLGSAAGALATILGVVFSITVLTLQLAAQQFTPRVLRRYLSDRGTQLVLGAFLATVSYLLLVLRAVEVGEDGDPGFVPHFSLFVGILATLGCLFLVAVFVHHLSVSIQPVHVCASVRKQALEALRASPARADELHPLVAPGPGVAIEAEKPGYLQLVDEEVLCELSPPGCVLRVEVRQGDFVLPGDPLATIRPAVPVEEQTAAKIRRAFRIGVERSPTHDLFFSVRQLVDATLKALAGDDVTTAMAALNELALILHCALRRNPRLHDGYRVLRREGSRLLVPVPGFATLLAHALPEIALAAGAHSRIQARQLQILGELAERAPREELRRHLQEEGRWLLRLAGGESGPADRLPWSVQEQLARLERRRGGPASHTIH